MSAFGRNSSLRNTTARCMQFPRAGEQAAVTVCTPRQLACARVAGGGASGGFCPRSRSQGSAVARPG
eukprot:1273281-Pleurochrysis_carterae.AAC.1